MTADQNKEVLRRFFNMYNAHDLSNLDEVFHTDMIYRSSAGDDTRGVDEFRQQTNAFFEAFPDTEVSIEEMVAQGNRVFVVYRWMGTQEKEYLKIESQGRRLDLRICGVATIEDGKVVDHFDFYDALTMLKQLGAVSEEVRPGGEDWPTGGTKLRPQR